ncbi:hypothetical protein V1527DRAFT_458760 [Lipomyces starkeyi]
MSKTGILADSWNGDNIKRLRADGFFEDPTVIALALSIDSRTCVFLTPSPGQRCREMSSHSWDRLSHKLRTSPRTASKCGMRIRTVCQ